MLIREKGISKLADLDLPALNEAAAILAGDPALDEVALKESILRRAAFQLGGGKVGDAVATLFGLTPETAILTAGVRRRWTAEKLGISFRTLTRSREHEILDQLTQQILRHCTEQSLRDSRDRMQTRTPAESGLALHWVEMFQAYYRLWSPIYALGSDLTAYRSTLLETPRPYDRRFGERGPDDDGYSQEEQAEGYATFALFHYAHHLWELRRFMNRYGGMWMLSNPQAEYDAPDAIHRISWHVSPYNERDYSLLRTTLDETPYQELHGFITRLASTELGRVTHEEWQEWVATCECNWDDSSTPDQRYFRSSSTDSGIRSTCQVHQVISACGDYCKTIDDDWNLIADWYRLPDQLRRGKDDEQRYKEWRTDSASSSGSEE
jgi:hypothetical protein